MSDKNRSLVMLGDIHGAFKRIMNRIKTLDMKNIDIVQVGDFGIGFKSLSEDKADMRRFNALLEERNCTLTAFRGNHDNPDMFVKDPFGLSNISIMPDNSIVELCGKKILMVGGAVSIDRKYREQMVEKWGVTYFEDEPFVFDKEALDNLDLSSVDIICTHTSPRFAFPTTFNTIVYDYADQDPGLLVDLEKERELITEFYEYVKPKMPNVKNYFYGHFHKSVSQSFDDIIFRLLDVDEFYELR